MIGPELAVIMDPIASIDPVKDSTLAMLLEAQARELTAERLDGSYREVDPETGQCPLYGWQRTR